MLEEHGGPEALRLAERPVPKPRAGEVVVDVHACALNRLDIWVRGGLPNLHVSYPHILGSDIVGQDVGRCETCLSGWDNLCPDYRILGENTTGGYAERIAVPVANLVDKPNKLSMVEAAAFPPRPTSTTPRRCPT